MQKFAGRLRDAAPRPLTEQEILEWADAHNETTSEWPRVQSGAVMAAPEENWANLNQLLQIGGRGLPGNSSLAKLLETHREVRNVNVPPRLTENQILAWAVAHNQRTGEWPQRSSGLIQDIDGENWAMIDTGLRQGLRGLPGGSSLAQLLSEKCGVRHQLEAPPLTIQMILLWADAEHIRSNTWPTQSTGPVADAPGETWTKVNDALASGGRGLPGDSSLAKLLAQERGVRNRKGLPSLTHEIILAWADADYKRTGEWPERDSGPIEDAPGETWANVNAALHAGFRGLAGGSSLARLLDEHRGVRNSQQLPALSDAQILAWADAHYERNGNWPRVLDGPIEDAPGETWSGVQNALRAGLRGLPGSSSLAALLSQQRGKSHLKNRPPLTIDQILAWADEHHQRVARWPNAQAGLVWAAPGETWAGINAALNRSMRGLRGNSSLATLLEEHRGVRNKSNLRSLTVEQILEWADAYYARAGKWPSQNSGAIGEAPGESWSAVHQALRIGVRGLPAGSSLARLIKEHRSSPTP
jgi:hypothetical protein